MLPELPVDSAINQILDGLRSDCNLVLEAPPGAGKTTRVPPALLQLDTRDVLVLEPRRIAARMAARRVAFELGERVGDTVGYQVRFEEVAGPRTRLRFLTEGVLTRRLLVDPELRKVGTVLIDEFHERHLDGDLALALLRRLQLTTRPDLRIVVMSATMEAGPIADYLTTLNRIRSEGRLFNVDVAYSGYSPSPLEEQVAAAVERTVAGAISGDILVFLPGAAEIRRAARACDAIARRANLLVLPLYGDLSPEEQDRAVGPASQRKLILSTNVAESSITIDGVTVVIDTGLARVAADSASNGLPTLTVQRISQASARQRAGRAGRTAPGLAIRLYTVEDFVRRPEYDIPEIRRRELSQVVLELRALGLTDVPWFEAPPEEAIAAANELLDRLHVADDLKTIARLPLHPRLARLVTASPTDDACAIVALISSGDRIEHADLLHAVDGGLPPRARQIASQIRSIARVRRQRAANDEELRKAVLQAFPDRVGRKQANVQLANGRFAAIAGEWQSEFLVAIDIEERREQPLPLIRLASSIEPEWLLDLYPERIRDVNEVTWNKTAERVESRSVLLYDELVIEESRSGTVDPELASQMLAAKAIEAGVHRFADPEELEHFLARAAFAAKHASLPPVSDAEIRGALESLAYGLRSFEELKAAAEKQGLIQALRSRWTAKEQREFDEVAPERIPLKGRMVKVHYVRDQQPWIASRLQDFFGLKQTPAIARGKTPLLVHLLAPNQRPVQMTTDLAGFWERLYPQVRRELARRYPKHSWPEIPA
jgi:ATP-dependent helicase HrpB